MVERSDRTAMNFAWRLSASGVWFYTGIATLVVSTVILFATLDRWPDPYVARDGASLMLQPIGPGPKAMPAINADLVDVYAPDESHVWVVGKNALIAYSSDGGAKWEKATIINPPDSAAAAPTTRTKDQSPPQHELASQAKGGSPRRLNPQNRPFEPRSFPEQQQQQQVAPPTQSKVPPKKDLTNGFSFLTSAFAADLKLRCVEHENLRSVGGEKIRGTYVVNAFGAAGGFYSSDGGQMWTCIDSEVPKPLYQQGTLADQGTTNKWRYEKGVLQHQGVGARSALPWVSVPIPTKQIIRGMRFANDNVGWAVGDHGVILKTTDGGKTWHHQTRESSYNESLLPGSPILPILPPWYLIANGFSAYAFFRSRTEAQKQERSYSQWIDSKGERDSPLEPEDADAHNLEPLAKAIADFIRNPETKPPMTIAVTGAWGSGKSSLMNLIRHRLMKAAWRPVWFNAWHHQKEESLLAALLQTIRMQAIPKLWERGGTSFYTRLVLIRLRNYQARVVALAMLVCFTVGFVMTYPLILDRLKDHSAAGHGLIDRIADFLPPATANLVLSIGTILTVLYGLSKGLNAFGVKPAELLAEVSNGARIKDLDAQMSFRERFAREFREVTDALNPWRSLLIFIDDLDRCHPSNVVEVLESINFLVTSGDCFVILGMARDKVQPAVGLAFKDMAAEMELPPGVPLNGEEAARKQRRDLARDYLDKLINFEVAVPRQSIEASLTSLTQEDETPSKKPRWYIDPLRAASVAALSAITVLLPLSMLFSGIAAATTSYVVNSEHDRQYIHAVGTKQKNDSVKEQPGRETPSPASVPVQASAVSNQPGTIARAAEVRDRWMYWPVFLPIIVLLWIAIWLIRRADEEDVRDSKEFTDALRIWHPVLYDRLTTPRAMKRFRNKLRFTAARVRAHAAAPGVPEHAIVAVSAIRLGYRDLNEYLNGPPVDLFWLCYKAHAEKFPVEELRQFDLRFNEVAGDVQFR